MSAHIIDGKKLAESFKTQIAEEVSLLKKAKGIVPGLAAVLVGENEASKIYVRNKETACKKVGMFAEQHNLPENVTEEELLHLVYTLNHDPNIHGILIQLPLPKQIKEQKIIEALLPEKDVDGFHPVNMGNLLIGNSSIAPCTPLGIIKMLESINCKIEGKEAIVLGRSNIVGKPIALLLMQRHATVTICHTRTKNLPDVVRRGEIVIAAVGHPQTVKGDWIREGAIVIDVGINRLPNGKLAGDVEFEEAKKRASFISPVPGGVGPMTIAMLLWNTLQAAKKSVG